MKKKYHQNEKKPISLLFSRKVIGEYSGTIEEFGRLYGKILQNKIEEEIKVQIDEDQVGFTAGRSYIDHIYTLQ